MRIPQTIPVAAVSMIAFTAPAFTADTSGKLKTIDEQKREIVLEDGRVFEICTCAQLDSFRTVKPGDEVMVLYYSNTNVATGVMKK